MSTITAHPVLAPQVSSLRNTITQRVPTCILVFAHERMLKCIQYVAVLLQLGPESRNGGIHVPLPHQCIRTPLSCKQGVIKDLMCVGEDVEQLHAVLMKMQRNLVDLSQALPDLRKGT